MSSSYTFTPATREQTIEHCHVAAQTFGEDAQRFLDEVDQYEQRSIEQTDVVACNGAVAAGMYTLPTGQFFGGKVIACAAVAGVAVAPEHRGRGAGRALMLGHIQQCRQRNTPVSALYASTPTFYRKVGYEPAGWVVRWKVDPDHLASAHVDGCDLVRAGRDDTVMREVYAAWAARHNGPLTRSDEFWARHVDPPRKQRHIYRIEFDGQAEGYAVLCHERHNGCLQVADLVALTPRAVRGAMALLYQHRSNNREVQWVGAMNDPLRKCIGENAARVQHIEEWLLRLCDVEAALSQRGYPPVHAELHLHVRDETMPVNAGRYVLTLRGGEPTVQRGGGGRIALDVRALTAIFTGHCTPADMQAADLLDGPADDLAHLALAFTGEPPFMIDQF